MQDSSTAKEHYRKMLKETNSRFEEMAADMFGLGSSSYLIATAPEEEHVPLTMEIINEAMAKIAPCPFAEFMKGKGCSPSNGWVMFVPKGLFPFADEDNSPSYVRISAVVEAPTLFKNHHTFGVFRR